MEKVRVRFAPSPTGPLHIGGVRTALYNYLFAKKHAGDFILRIEDTDKTRFVEGAEKYIVDSLKWLKIEPNEGVGFGGGNHGPYKQSERADIYKQYIQQLIDSGKAYYAFDTPEDLDQLRKLSEEKKETFSYDAQTRDNLCNSLSLTESEVQKKINAGEPYVIRIKINPNEKVQFTDIIRGSVVFDSTTMDDKVLFKSDGLPTYHFANVVDDHLMKISHVIRGEEWLPSAPLHVLLYEYLGWGDTMPQFAHLPLILKPTGKGKLSKRDGDAGGFPVFPLEWNNADGTVYSGYREVGYLKEAVVNILAFLGWNPGTEQELFTLEELTKSFDLNRVGKAGARFDPDKALWYNQQHLMQMTGEAIAEVLLQRHAVNLPEESLTRVCELMKERVSFVHEIPQKGHYFFSAPIQYDEKTVKKKWKERSPEIIDGLSKVFESTNWNSEQIETSFKNYIEKQEIGFGLAMISLRLAITGEGGGPSLFDTMEILGKEESLARMQNAIANITKNNPTLNPS